MPVKYHNDNCTFRLLHKRLISRWLCEVAHSEGCVVGEINYIFCSAERLLEMNRQYLQHNYYTDVITFDYGDLDASRTVSGDIFIDIETVRDNALQYRTTAAQEMRRVIVHGLLHLCGQKDKTPHANKQMHAKEDKYLALLSKMEGV